MAHVYYQAKQNGSVVGANGWYSSLERGPMHDE